MLLSNKRILFIVRNVINLVEKFPSTAPKYETDRNENIPATVNQIVKSHKESRGACKELTKI